MDAIIDLCSDDETVQVMNSQIQSDSNVDEFEAAAHSAKNLKSSIAISSNSPDSNGSEWETDSDFETTNVRPIKRRKFVSVKSESQEEVEVLTITTSCGNENVPKKGAKFATLKETEVFLDKYSAPLHFKFVIESGPHANRGPEKNMNYRV